MPLLNRIATSNGNKLRKAAANLTLAAMDDGKVSDWNRRLQSEICQKTVKRNTASLVASLLKIQRLSTDVYGDYLFESIS